MHLFFHEEARVCVPDISNLQSAAEIKKFIREQFARCKPEVRERLVTNLLEHVSYLVEAKSYETSPGASDTEIRALQELQIKLFIAD